MRSKKAAIELSMTTIVVVVLSLTLLIMGFVLVRSVMCSSINLVTDIGAKSKDQVNKLFGATGGEVECFGDGDPVAIFPGRANYIQCIISAKQEAKYSFDYKVNEAFTNIPEDTVKRWVIMDFNQNIAPGDEESKAIAQINLPEEAPEGDIVLDVEVKKDGSLVSTKRLKFEVTRVGLVRSALC